jgi:hypothetical protein
MPAQGFMEFAGLEQHGYQETRNSGVLRLADDLGFANVCLSPDVEGHTLAHKRAKRFKEYGRFH